MQTDSFPAKIFVFAVCKFTQLELLSFSLKSLSFTHSCNGITEGSAVHSIFSFYLFIYHSKLRGFHLTIKPEKIKVSLLQNVSLAEPLLAIVTIHL